MIKTKAKKLYKDTYRILPSGMQRMIAELDFRIASHTRTERRTRVPSSGQLERGVVTISLDFEMAWAWQYGKNLSRDCISIALEERHQVPIILDVLGAYGIPATWATVGHLFLEGCVSGARGLPHESLPRLQHFETALWRFNSGDWFQFDPCTNVTKDPAWYAPDLIESILRSTVRHEVACHSFSHVGFRSYCPKEVATGEIQACAAAMARFGLKPTTWIFPGNDDGHYDLLAKEGVRVVRASMNPSIQIGLPVHRSDGICLIHASSGLDRGRHWPLAHRLHRLKKFVDVAIDTRMVAHIWFHPSLPRAEINDLLVPFLAYCAGKREQGSVDILTMERLAAITEEVKA